MIETEIDLRLGQLSSTEVASLTIFSNIQASVKIKDVDVPWEHNPCLTAPSVFLNPAWSPGAVAAGSQVVYENVPITYFVFSGDLATPADFKLQLSIYVQGGSQPIPTPGIDYLMLTPITIQDTTTPIILSEPLDVEVVEPFTGSCP